MIFLSATVCCLVLAIIGIFVFSTALEAIFGVMIGCLYVIIDTQMIIFKAQHSVCEPFLDALNLFIDLFKIFIEITKLLIDDKKKKSKD